MTLNAQLTDAERSFVSSVVREVIGDRQDVSVTVVRSANGQWLVGVTPLVERVERLTWGYRPGVEGAYAELAISIAAALRSRAPRDC